jgi:hypothetical protein
MSYPGLSPNVRQSNLHNPNEDSLCLGAMSERKRNALQVYMEAGHSEASKIPRGPDLFNAKRFGCNTEEAAGLRDHNDVGLWSSPQFDRTLGATLRTLEGGLRSVAMGGAKRSSPPWHCRCHSGATTASTTRSAPAKGPNTNSCAVVALHISIS